MLSGGNTPKPPRSPETSRKHSPRSVRYRPGTVAPDEDGHTFDSGQSALATEKSCSRSGSSSDEEKSTTIAIGDGLKKNQKRIRSLKQSFGILSDTESEHDHRYSIII